MSTPNERLEMDPIEFLEELLEIHKRGSNPAVVMCEAIMAQLAHWKDLVAEDEQRQQDYVAEAKAKGEGEGEDEGGPNAPGEGSESEGGEVVAKAVGEGDPIRSMSTYDQVG